MNTIYSSVTIRDRDVSLTFYFRITKPETVFVRPVVIVQGTTFVGLESCEYLPMLASSFSRLDFRLDTPSRTVASGTTVPNFSIESEWKYDEIRERVVLKCWMLVGPYIANETEVETGTEFGVKLDVTRRDISKLMSDTADVFAAYDQ